MSQYKFQPFLPASIGAILGPRGHKMGPGRPGEGPIQKISSNLDLGDQLGWEMICYKLFFKIFENLTLGAWGPNRGPGAPGVDQK